MRRGNDKILHFYPVNKAHWSTSTRVHLLITSGCVDAIELPCQPRKKRYSTKKNSLPTCGTRVLIVDFILIFTFLVWAISLLWKSFLILCRLSLLYRLSLAYLLGPPSLGYLLSGPFQGRVTTVCPTAPGPSSASYVSPVISGLSTLTSCHSPLLPLSGTSHNLLTGLTPAFTIWDLPPSPTPPVAHSQGMLNHSFYLSVPSVSSL